MVSTKPRLPRTPDAGFTLLEVLIVMVIIGIVATIAVLALGDFGTSRRVKTAATDLSLILPAVSQQAIFRPAILGVRIAPHSYAFYQYVRDTKTGKSTWVLITRDTLLNPKTLPTDITLTLSLAGQSIILAVKNKQAQPQIVFLPDGNNNAFSIGVGETGSAPMFEISGNTSGNVTMTAVTR